jgi:hypothetical protein
MTNIETEADWLACTDPQKMLQQLRGKSSDRKLRLFAVACFRRLVTLLPDLRQRRGIEALERLAEGTITRLECRGVTAEVRQAIPLDDWVADQPPTDSPHYIALMLYREFCSSSIATHAVSATAGLADGVSEQHEQVQLMRCIFGNPFRSVASFPSWLTWHDGTVTKLAEAIYEERAFDRLPILADALEEAGCDNADILKHCRSEGPHVRGCWALDAVLGRV